MQNEKVKTPLRAMRHVLSALCLLVCTAVHASTATATNEITSIQFVPRLSIQSEVGSSNIIQYSTDQVNWTNLATLKVMQSSYEFYDTNVLQDYSQPPIYRFYRFVVIPPDLRVVEIESITSQTVSEGDLLTFAVQATQGGLPSQTLVFSLAPGAPAGASITSSGLFSWTPAEFTAGSYTITVVVADSSTPGLTDDETFAVTVNPAGMAIVSAGVFSMGDSLDRSSDAPEHTVSVSMFEMQKNLTSFGEWQKVYQWAISNGYTFDNPGKGLSPKHPVQSVSWYDVVKWCNARSEMGHLTPCYYTGASQTSAAVYRTGVVVLSNSFVNWTANGYRLPTEAEWEKAARGNLEGKRFPLGDVISHTNACYNTARLTTWPYDLGPLNVVQTGPVTVGSYPPNGYGLYDMAGNMREWCWDWYEANYYKSSPNTNPKGPEFGRERILRGGGWKDLAKELRCAVRLNANPILPHTAQGFRCIRGTSE
jgi:formylglycine-generating enzyme